jgi:hypothetical protein
VPGENWVLVHDRVSLLQLENRGVTVAQVNRKQHGGKPDNRPASVPYAASGHPSVEQLTAEQGTGPINDVTVLHGDFWPEDESIEDFVATIREWRGHKRTDSSA